MQQLKPKCSVLDDVVFVTAASDDHFYGAVLSLRRMRQAFPKAKLIFYGLALSEDNPEKVNGARHFGQKLFV